VIIYLANTEYSQEFVENQIRQKYLKKFYEAEFVTETQPAVEDNTGEGAAAEPEPEKPKEDVRAKRDKGKRAEVKGQSAAERRASARAAAKARSRQRSSMEQSIAGQGVFAELAASGGGGSGAAVADVLGDQEAGGFGNLDQVLSGVSGLQTATSSSRRSQLGARKMGGGVSGTAGIDDLIEGGVGQTGSKSIARRGNFSIKMGKGSVSGRASKSTSRSTEAIGRVVTQHQDAIENCYRKEARLNPNLKGSIRLQFTIQPNGRVSRVRIVQSTLKNRKVESCVKRRVNSWRFQPINPKEGSVTFRQKFIFSS
jgi:TonB family protein